MICSFSIPICQFTSYYIVVTQLPNHFVQKQGWRKGYTPPEVRVAGCKIEWISYCVHIELR